jgi:alginate O-acetyltransferase complex protein AlgI
MWPQITRTVTLRTAPHRQYAPIPRPPETGISLYPGEPETCRRNLPRFLAIWGHLGLLYALFHVYQLEGRAFRLLAVIALCALPVHYLLHYRWKKPFFLATSVAGFVWVFGLSVAAIVLPVAALLIGACYLPIAWRARALLIGILAVALALLRTRTPGASFDCAWPILGSMFMFRMILYLYELKHAEKRETLVDTLSYFFLLPNYCFLLFPVVDYRTLQRSYFASDVHATLRCGLQMIFRGTIHLLLYRLIYHELLINVDEVHSVASLASYLVCNYLLYLHVSGQFHLACGMLHLFGFQLPETHRRYLLATGFTDYWRRINIYWKDFMVRVVFNPLVFRLKRWPQSANLATATAVVFVTTWLLHAYQSFWLWGSWKFSVPDALFWGILGLLVMINVQRDALAPRGRLRKGIDLAPRALAVRALKTAATFSTIALLWSLWSSPTLGAWFAMFRHAFVGAS